MDAARVMGLAMAARIVCVTALLLAGCGGDGGSDGASVSASGPRVLVDSTCSGASLRSKNYFLTVRQVDSSDVLVNGGKLENLPRVVRLEEVIIDGKPFAGIAIPIPSGVPKNQPLQLIVLASDGDLLPTCVAQLTHVVTSDADSVFVTALQDMTPKVGLRRDVSANTFESVCNTPPSLELDFVASPAAQLHGAVCYQGTYQGQTLTYQYKVADNVLDWQSSKANIVTVSNSGAVTARGNGAAEVTVSLRNAQGSVVASVVHAPASPGDPTTTAPTVSMSNAVVQEGNDGVNAVGFTVQIDHAVNVPVMINYATSSVSALPGVDYCSDQKCSNSAELLGSVLIPAGKFKSDPINVFINGDTAPEAAERFDITLTSTSDAAMSASAEITIQNDDGPVSQVYAKGVGLWNATRGEINIRAPGPGDKAYLVWNQKTPTLGDVRFTNEDSNTSHRIVASDLIGEHAIVDEAATFQACFVAQLPAAMLATVSSDNLGRYTISNKDSLDGAGIIVVTGLLGKTEVPVFTKGLHTIATFTDGSSDTVGHVVQLKAGCDFFFHGSKGSENSEVVNYTFAMAQQDRVAKITFFATDARPASDPGRGSEVRVLVGNAQSEIPERLDDKTECTLDAPAFDCVRILGSDLTPTRPALVGNNGDGWDTFGQYSGTHPSNAAQTHDSAFRDPDLRGLITVPAGASFVSVQVMSPASRRGESSTLPLMAFELFPIAQN